VKIIEQLIVDELARNGPKTAREIEIATGRAKASVGEALRVLLRLGHIQRETVEQMGRAVFRYGVTLCVVCGDTEDVRVQRWLEDDDTLAEELLCGTHRPPPGICRGPQRRRAKPTSPAVGPVPISREEYEQEVADHDAIANPTGQ